MTALAVGVVVLGTTFGGALLGTQLRRVLPEHHLTRESQDVVKLSMGLVATMCALVLGLLIASANSSFDTRRSELRHLAVEIVLLDRVLALYGTDAAPVRATLRERVARAIEAIWPRDGSRPQLDPAAARGDEVYRAIQALHPADDQHRSLQADALRMSGELGQTRWLLFAEQGLAIPMPFLVVLIVWLALLFVGFGLFGPANGTVLVALLLSAVSVSSAIFIMLELADPYGGVIHVSEAPLTQALAHLGQ